MKHIIPEDQKEEIKINGDLKKIRKQFSIPRQIREEIYKESNNQCFYCGVAKLPEQLTLDHYIPFKESLDNNKDNLRACCQLCNQMKKDTNPLTDPEWIYFSKKTQINKPLNLMDNLAHTFKKGEIPLPALLSNIKNIIDNSQYKKISCPKSLSSAIKKENPNLWKSMNTNGILNYDFLTLF